MLNFKFSLLIFFIIKYPNYHYYISTEPIFYFLSSHRPRRRVRHRPDVDRGHHGGVQGHGRRERVAMPPRHGMDQPEAAGQRGLGASGAAGR